MSNGVGCGAFIIAAIFSGLVMYLTGSFIVGALLFIPAFGVAIANIQEGMSKGSGYRQEQQNKEILEELRKQNKQNGGQ